MACYCCRSYAISMSVSCLYLSAIPILSTTSLSICYDYAFTYYYYSLTYLYYLYTCYIISYTIPIYYYTYYYIYYYYLFIYYLFIYYASMCCVWLCLNALSISYYWLVMASCCYARCMHACHRIIAYFLTYLLPSHTYSTTPTSLLYPYYCYAYWD